MVCSSFLRWPTCTAVCRRRRPGSTLFPIMSFAQCEGDRNIIQSLKWSCRCAMPGSTVVLKVDRVSLPNASGQARICRLYCQRFRLDEPHVLFNFPRRAPPLPVFFWSPFRVPPLPVFCFVCTFAFLPGKLVPCNRRCNLILGWFTRSRIRGALPTQWSSSGFGAAGTTCTSAGLVSRSESTDGGEISTHSSLGVTTSVSPLNSLPASPGDARGGGDDEGKRMNCSNATSVGSGDIALSWKSV